MVGMRDVAKKAGVALSTVSLVVNQSGYVSEQMRRRVESAMRELDYIPNELARNLYHGRSHIIGVIVPTIEHPFFSTLTAHLQQVFAKRGLYTMLCSTFDVGEGEATYVDMLRRRMMDGIIMGAHTDYPAHFWTSIERPVVAFDRFIGPEIKSVGSDHEQGGELAATIFALTGVRHVVEIGGARSRFHDVADGGAAGVAAEADKAEVLGSHTTFPPVRYQLSFESVLSAAGIRYDYMEIPSVADLSEFERVARRAFERFPDADAIMAPDLAASFCVQEALRRGIRIPDSLQILAYDGTYVTDAAGMKITSILQDFPSIARSLSDCMLETISKDAGVEVDGDASDTNPEVLREGHVTDEEASMVGNLSHTIPMKVKIGQTTRWNEAIRELLLGSHPQTD
ncbi:LacI family DNA-binding transcriptional regulator [Bifidobacterium psychraerophilum]|uniref:LacI family transcriptional regulator n=1 Tax=Bifidobacterium psychraerophilum TaxID=218140 RepID=A0A087CI10_9BIFI|nr:LacI family DNA-binding transcriptional regulator [Bifidobacterium psychraerophilum]KFI82910.1 LacI family transcriptional regulator [Bifidobacterium psychraerophilum]PKA94657.1 LacI family transcriptional regulator [Bifidobacterium psychraerophilum DSM 22366]